VGVIAVPFAALGLPWLLPMVPRRRRRTGPVALLVACILGGAANTAKAELPTDETPAWWNMEMRYGSVNLDDQGLRDTYGASGHDLFQVEIGPQLWRFFEVDAGFAYLRDVATTLDANGEPSGTESRYTLAPLTLDATFRLHVLDEQPFVPFVRAGMDYVIWNEAWQAGASTDRNRGAKGGYHYGFGGQILLDTFNRRRASILEAGTGINDTWVTVEWRRQRVEPGKVLFFNNSEGTSFSSTVLSIGLKLDY